MHVVTEQLSVLSNRAETFQFTLQYNADPLSCNLKQLKIIDIYMTSICRTYNLASISHNAHGVTYNATNVTCVLAYAMKTSMRYGFISTRHV